MQWIVATAMVYWQSTKERFFWNNHDKGEREIDRQRGRAKGQSGKIYKKKKEVKKMLRKIARNETDILFICHRFVDKTPLFFFFSFLFFHQAFSSIFPPCLSYRTLELKSRKTELYNFDCSSVNCDKVTESYKSKTKSVNVCGTHASGSFAIVALFVSFVSVVPHRRFLCCSLALVGFGRVCAGFSIVVWPWSVHTF